MGQFQGQMTQQHTTLRAKLDELDRHVSHIWSPVRQEGSLLRTIPELAGQDEKLPPGLALFKRLVRLLRGN